MPNGADNQPVGGHRSSVPRFQGRAANRALEAGNLPTGGYFLGSAVDSAAPTGSVMRFEHARLCARKTKQATSKFDLAIERREPRRSLVSPFQSGHFLARQHRDRMSKRSHEKLTLQPAARVEAKTPPLMTQARGRTTSSASTSVARATGRSCS